MAGVRGFQQDPAGPPGMGMFDFDDGSSLYAHNPEAAAPFMQQEPDERTASIGGALRNAVNIAGGPLATALVPRASDTGEERKVEPSVADVGPNMSPAPVEPEYSQAPQQSATQAPLVSESQAPTAAQQQRGPAAPQAPGGMPAISPLIHTAAHPARYVPQTKSEETTGSALPVSEEEVKRRNADFMDVMSAKKQYLGAIAAQEEAAQQQIAQQREAMAKGIAAATAERDAALNAKVDSGRYFHEMGTATKIGLAIAQGMMAFGAALTHTQNPMMNWIQGAVDRDVADQQENYKRQGLRAQNKLTDLMQKYQLNSEQASSVLKNLQSMKVAAIGQEYAAASGQKQLEQAWNAYATQAIAKHNEDNIRIIRDAAGTAKTSTSSRYQQASAGGLAVNPDYKALLSLKKEEASVAKAEHETGWAAGTVFPDEGTFQRSYLKAVSQNPELTPEQFKHANLEKGGTGTLPRGPLASADVKSRATDAGVQAVVDKSGGALYRGQDGQIHARGESFPGAGVAQAAWGAFKNAFNIGNAPGMTAAKQTTASEYASVLSGGNAPAKEDKAEAHEALATGNPVLLAARLNEIERQSKAMRQSIREMRATGVGEEPLGGDERGRE